jgi:hypothetical protein
MYSTIGEESEHMHVDKYASVEWQKAVYSVFKPLLVADKLGLSAAEATTDLSVDRYGAMLFEEDLPPNRLLQTIVIPRLKAIIDATMALPFGVRLAQLRFKDYPHDNLDVEVASPASLLVLICAQLADSQRRTDRELLYVETTPLSMEDGEYNKYIAESGESIHQLHVMLKPILIESRKKKFIGEPETTYTRLLSTFDQVFYTLTYMTYYPDAEKGNKVALDHDIRTLQVLVDGLQKMDEFTVAASSS